MEGFEIDKSKVYIKTDENNRILFCDGGYTINNIENIDDWIFIDEGFGDKYNLCQSHYFVGGLYTNDGICRYKYINGEIALRTTDEIKKDLNALFAESEPIPDTDTNNDVWVEMAKAINEGVNDV